MISNPYLARDAWADRGADTPYHALETMLWAGVTGNRQRLLELTVSGDDPPVLNDRPPLMKIKGVQIVSVDGGADGMTRIGAIIEEQFYGAGLNSPPGTVQNIRFWLLVQENNEWKIAAHRGGLVPK